MNDQPTDWPAAWTALAAMDGDQWDDEDARLTTLWKAEYVNAFVTFAISRAWTRENAETCATELDDTALGYGSDVDPSYVARGDVINCELEAANAG